MNIKENIETIKKILKFVPQQYKKETLKAVAVKPQKNGKAEPAPKTENLSRNELKERLRLKIQELRQKQHTSGNDEDEDGEKKVPIVKKKIHKIKKQRKDKGNNVRSEKKKARLLNQEKNEDGAQKPKNNKDQANKAKRNNVKKGQNNKKGSK